MAMKKVLISGAGIAGPTLAYWLKRYGWQPVIVERAPELRTGGYVIDFWGKGYEIAERMGLLPEALKESYQLEEVRVVNDRGRTVTRIAAEGFSKALEGKYTSLLRGDLAAAIYRSLQGGVETVFGDSIAGIAQDESGVEVELESGQRRNFDLVVGADGLHSRVRRLAFGPQEKFERYLGYKAAVFQLDGYQPRDELVYVMFTEVGQQAARFSMRDGKTMFLLTFIDEQMRRKETEGVEGQKAYLRRRFERSGWECGKILRRMDDAKELYFDRVSQIHMGHEPGSWSRGRVTLVGDAASCVSLLAGQGSSLAMTGAYILAGELKRAGEDYAAAFRKYEERFRPFVEQKQKTALGYASTFAPRSRFQLFVRNRAMSLFGWKPVTKFVVRRGLIDRIELPEY